ncbi:MAG: TIGR03032 family protein [Bacteroidota bacterium]
MNTPKHTRSLSPFSCVFSPNIPELLLHLNCSIVLSTYQAGKVVFISPKNEEELVQLPRTFKRPMGIGLSGQKMAVATQDEIVILANSPRLAQSYPKKPQTYDALWTPRAAYFTGPVDIHDLHFGKQGLWAVNTSFSCLCSIDDDFSFTPRWKPPFISQLVGEDRCHLNGLAMLEGQPKFFSALGRGDSKQSWRENIVSGGVIIDIENNRIVAEGLAMPHTPRLYDGQLYVLLSAAEQLVRVDTISGNIEEVTKIPGFLRGMAKQEDFLFIATSRLRKNSSTFKHLQIVDKADVASIVIVHLPTAAIVGKIEYQASVDEIYEVQILPNSIRPNILNTYGEIHHQSVMLPNGSAYWRQLEE